MNPDCERVRSWRKRNPEKYKAITARYNRKKRIELRDETRRVIREVKSKPCADCGVSYPYFVMDFDHRDDKQFTISRPTSYHNIGQLMAEIAKCDIVCANCHRIRTHSRGR